MQQTLITFALAALLSAGSSAPQVATAAGSTRPPAAELQVRIALKATEDETTTRSAATAQAPAAPVRKVRAGGARGLHMVEMRGHAMLFTITHATAQTAFHAPPAMQRALLAAAMASGHIEVRGRTDADTPSQADRDIALNRAMRAYAFLVRHGVAPERIKVTFEASGHFAVDNSTAEGKARNRRVEVEVVNTDATNPARRA